MKTSLIIPDEVYRAVKRRAADTDRTIGQIVAEGMREWLVREEASAKPYRLRLPVVKGSRKPAVDVNDRDALLDFMERRA